MLRALVAQEPGIRHPASFSLQPEVFEVHSPPEPWVGPGGRGVARPPTAPSLQPDPRATQHGAFLHAVSPEAAASELPSVPTPP